MSSAYCYDLVFFKIYVCIPRGLGVTLFKQLTLHIMVVLLFFIGYKSLLSGSNDLELSIVSVIRIIAEFVSLYFKDHIALLLYFRYHPSFTRSSIIF